MQISIAIIVGKCNDFANNVRKMISSFEARVFRDTGLFEAYTCLSTALTNLSRTQLLNRASLILTPNAVKESKLYSIVPSNGNGDMTVIRATTATRINSEGFIEETPYNLLKYSEDCSNSAWTKANSTVISNNNLAPNGTNTASRISMPIDGASSQLYNAIPTSAGVYTVSVWVRLVSGAGDFNLGFYDFSTIQTSPITVTSSWKLFTVTKTIALYAGTRGCWLYSYSIDNIIEVWGAQIVQGSLPKDYFYTTDRLNVPRLNYDTVGGCPSILLEPQRTNLITYSNDFSNAVWVKMNSIVLTPNVSISPDGTINASRITANIAFNQRLDYPITILANTTYTFSVYAKKGTQNQGNFRLAASSTIETFLDFTLTDNFVKYSITIPNTNLNTSIIVRIYPSNPISGPPFLAGDNAIIYGAQLEQGAYPTSYIPTVASTVTRNADVIEGQVNSNNFNSLEGVLFAETSALSNDQTNRVISVSDGTAANRILLRYDTISNEIAATVILNNINVVNLTYSTDITKYIKIAFRYKALDFGLFINGVKISSSSYANIFNNNTLNILKLTESPSGSIFNGKIKGLQVYKTALTNNECISLTTL